MDEELILLLLGGFALYLYSVQAQASQGPDIFTTDFVQPLEAAVLPIENALQPVTSAVYNSYDTFTSNVEDYMTGTTRGERNNNPGNLRKGANWQGLSADQSSDSAFAVFNDPVSGIRALAVLLKNYAASGFNTVASIISRYAPSSENNTNAYISAVAGQIGVDPNQVLDLNDSNLLTALCSAIITHENGQDIYTAQGITAQGVALA